MSMRACMLVSVSGHAQLCTCTHISCIYIFKTFKVRHIYKYKNDLLCFAVVCNFITEVSETNFYNCTLCAFLSVCFQFLLLIFLNIFDVGICFCLKNQYSLKKKIMLVFVSV